MTDDDKQVFVRSAFSAVYLIAASDGHIDGDEIQSLVDALIRSLDWEADFDDALASFESAIKVEDSEHIERVAEARSFPEALRHEILRIAVDTAIADGEADSGELLRLKDVARALGIALEGDSESAELADGDDVNVPSTEGVSLFDLSLKSNSVFEPIAELMQNAIGQRATRFVPGRNEIIALDKKGDLHFFDAETGRTIAHCRRESAGQNIEVSPDGKFLVIFGWTIKSPELWSIPDRSLRGTLDYRTGRGKGNANLALERSDDDLYFDGDDAEDPGAVESAIFNAGGSFLFTGTDNGWVLKWATSDLTCIYAVDGVTESVDKLAINTAGTLLAAAQSLTSSVHVLDASTGRRRLELQLPGHAQDLLFHPQSNSLITSSTDGKAKPFQVWDISKGELIASFGRSAGRAGSVATACFSADGRHVLTNHSGALHIWGSAEFDCQSELQADGLAGIAGSTLVGAGSSAFGVCTADLADRSEGACFLWDCSTGGVLSAFKPLPVSDPASCFAAVNDKGDRTFFGSRLGGSSGHVSLILLRLTGVDNDVQGDRARAQRRNSSSPAAGANSSNSVAQLTSEPQGVFRVAAGAEVPPTASNTGRGRGAKNTPAQRKGFWSRLFGR